MRKLLDVAMFLNNFMRYAPAWASNLDIQPMRNIVYYVELEKHTIFFVSRPKMPRTPCESKMIYNCAYLHRFGTVRTKWSFRPNFCRFRHFRIFLLIFFSCSRTVQHTTKPINTRIYAMLSEMDVRRGQLHADCLDGTWWTQTFHHVVGGRFN